MRLRFPELQDNNKEITKLTVEKLLKGKEDIKEILYYKNFLYVLKIISSKLISK